jgi:hypothetical protein
MYHALTKTIFGFVGLRWFIFGSDGYSLVTVLLLAKDPSALDFFLLETALYCLFGEY